MIRPLGNRSRLDVIRVTDRQTDTQLPLHIPRFARQCEVTHVHSTHIKTKYHDMKWNEISEINYIINSKVRMQRLILHTTTHIMNTEAS